MRQFLAICPAFLQLKYVLFYKYVYFSPKDSSLKVASSCIGSLQSQLRVRQLLLSATRPSPRLGFPFFSILNSYQSLSILQAALIRLIRLEVSPLYHRSSSLIKSFSPRQYQYRSILSSYPILVEYYQNSLIQAITKPFQHRALIAYSTSAFSSMTLKLAFNSLMNPSYIRKIVRVVAFILLKSILVLSVFVRQSSRNPSIQFIAFPSSNITAQRTLSVQERNHSLLNFLYSLSCRINP